MNVLLHVCCAPCAISAIEEIRKDGHSPTLFFYNPNIHPHAEYVRRKEATGKYALGEAIPVEYGDYDIETYFRCVSRAQSGALRCLECWRLRIETTGRLAGEDGFDAFTTTLLASPYQDHQILKKLGEDTAKSCGAGFYYKDFRVSFRAAHQKAKEAGIYCQRYCGCVFSEKEMAQHRARRETRKKNPVVEA